MFLPMELNRYEIYVPQLHQVWARVAQISKMTAGPNGIPRWVYSEEVHNLVVRLTHIFNFIIKTCTTRKVWKLSELYPPAKTNCHWIKKANVPPRSSIWLLDILRDWSVPCLYKVTMRLDSALRRFTYTRAFSIECAWIKVLNNTYNLRKFLALFNF